MIVIFNYCLLLVASAPPRQFGRYTPRDALKATCKAVVAFRHAARAT
jgi:hypothetical protein